MTHSDQLKGFLEGERGGWEHFILPVYVRAPILGRSGPWPPLDSQGLRDNHAGEQGFNNLVLTMWAGHSRLLPQPRTRLQPWEWGQFISGCSQGSQLPPLCSCLLICIVSLRGIDSRLLYHGARREGTFQQVMQMGGTWRKSVDLASWAEMWWCWLGSGWSRWAIKAWGRGRGQPHPCQGVIFEFINSNDENSATTYRTLIICQTLYEVFHLDGSLSLMVGAALQHGSVFHWWGYRLRGRGTCPRSLRWAGAAGAGAQ